MSEWRREAVTGARKGAAARAAPDYFKLTVAGAKTSAPTFPAAPRGLGMALGIARPAAVAA